MLRGSRFCDCRQQPAAQHMQQISKKLLQSVYRPQHTRQQQRQGVRAAAVDYRIAAPPVKLDTSGTADEVRSLLVKIGWERAWIDGITERIFKMEFQTSASTVEEVVQFLEGLGIPSQFVCNMASRVPSILGRDSKTELQPVVDYIQKQGVKGEALKTLLQDYPRLLLFAPSPDGKVLHYDQTRASVDVVHDRYRGTFGNVSYWREGAAFETAPLSPLKPAAPES